MIRLLGPTVGVLVPFAVLAGCGRLGPERSTAHERRLEDAVPRWEANGPADYRMAYERSCFCASEVVAPVEITVRGGSVVERRFAGSGFPVPAELASLYLPVAAIFEEIRRAIRRGAWELRAAYDPALGYPVEVFIDLARGVDDDEVLHRVLELSPLD